MFFLPIVDEFVQQITSNLEALAQQQLHQQQGALSQIVRNCLHSELKPSIEYEMHRTVVPGWVAIEFKAVESSCVPY